jgi:2,4-dienoyl-CoA reductase-like NADH-dependent reductase (Old Yellow Enzyme family)
MNRLVLLLAKKPRDEDMPTLFEPIIINGLTLKNRAVRSATWDGAAEENGAATDGAVKLFSGLAKGQIGLIISGHAYVTTLGQGSPNQYGIHNDDMIPGLSRLTEAVHKEGGKIAAQITHCGINSGYLRRKGLVCQAVSNLTEIETPHKEMTEAEIEAIVGDFTRAARRAVSAGFDAVQLHGAHGFLMSEFLSPFFNRRTDQWGGNPENRRRFHIEVIKAVRNEIGKDYPLFIKLGGWEDMEGGLTLEEGIMAAQAMVEAGLDAIELSVGARGASRTAAQGAPEHPYFRKESAALKRAVHVPVMLVGGIRSLTTANDILSSGDADMISMSRPFIRQPDLLLRWQQGEADAKCISCSKCFPSEGNILSCGEERRLREAGLL